MDIEKIMGEIIPPNDRQHREGFNNIGLIEKLTAAEKTEVENKLIDKLKEPDNSIDNLVVETLVYLKSEKSLPFLYDKLNYNYKNKLTKLFLAVSIFEINMDRAMVDIAISSFKKVDNKWDFIFAFYYLSKFHSPLTNDLIKKYVNHRDFLISSNASSYYDTNLS